MPSAVGAAGAVRCDRKSRCSGACQSGASWRGLSPAERREGHPRTAGGRSSRSRAVPASPLPPCSVTEDTCDKGLSWPIHPGRFPAPLPAPHFSNLLFGIILDLRESHQDSTDRPWGPAVSEPAYSLEWPLSRRLPPSTRLCQEGSPGRESRVSWDLSRHRRQRGRAPGGVRRCWPGEARMDFLNGRHQV